MMAVLYLFVILGGWLLCSVAERAVPASMTFLHANQRGRSGVAWRRVRRLKTATRLVPMSQGTATSGEFPEDSAVESAGQVGPLGVSDRNAVELKAGDLISVARLTEPIDPGVRDVPSIALDPSQRQPYIGQERVGDILRKLVGHYKANDRDRVVRVEPMIITRFSRGGKTRLMKQIGAGLHAQGIPALFITFNEQTVPTDFELSACSPL
ncbi:unnamed protein product [Vitrella brassicaformis CCMP3155]|uniref:Uncharacterized protein n=1 Tax=Vitrella brassicaformis (strain CCMP3155) TaxID=1169540 RepID=A0A0G4FH89_VITBC|nr:unnamed protein product [Vitrella brassicaformis CCMP3155]|eukprot:CEM12874.1 unnamed protein product [Vitrella brassicaformis CCMP3155]